MVYQITVHKETFSVKAPHAKKIHDAIIDYGGKVKRRTWFTTYTCSLLVKMVNTWTLLGCVR